MVLQMENTRQKTFSLEIYRQKYSIGDSGISSKYFSTLDKIPIDVIRL
jgi:hypothetical protein